MARVLGIDIQDGKLRIAVVRTSLRRLEVESLLTLAEDELRTVTPDHQPVSQPAALEEFDDETWPGQASPPDAAPVSPLAARVGAYDFAVASLAGAEVSVHTLELPRVAARHLDNVVPNELESLLPFDIDDVVWDYQIALQDSQSLKVLAAAASTTTVSDCLDHLRELGLAPRELAAGASALDGLIPLVPELQGDRPLILLDFAINRTDVCIVHNGHCVFARTVSQPLGTSSRDSEALRMELLRTLSAYRANGGPAPVQAYITGTRSHATNLPEWVAEVVHVPVALLELPGPESVAGEQRRAYARALALAARVAGRGKRINLRKGAFASAPTVSVLRQKSRLLAACGAAIVVALSVSTYGRVLLLDRQREALQHQLGQVTRDIFGEEAKTATAARALLEGDDAANNPLPKIGAYDLLEAVSDSIPTDIVHDTRQLHIELGLGSSRGRLELEGVLSNNSERARIARNLEEHECVQEIKEAGTSPAGDGRLRYQLEAVLECPHQNVKKGKSNRADD